MAKVLSTFVVLFLLSGCAAERKREPIVPDETQRKSENLYGQQSQMMNSLNQTPAEQAAARHENATRPVERDDEKPGSESRE